MGLLTNCLIVIFLIVSIQGVGQLDYSEYKGNVLLNNYTAIQHRNKTIGYNIIFRVENKQSNKLFINLLDLNAELISRYELDQANGVHVIESAYNGSELAILFLNTGAKKIELKLFDANSHIIRSFDQSLNENEVQFFIGRISQTHASRGQNTFLHELDTLGFALMYNTIEENLYTTNIFKLHHDSTNDRFYHYMSDRPIFESKFLGRKHRQLYFSFEKAGSKKGSLAADIVALGELSFEPIFDISQDDKNKQLFIPIEEVKGSTSKNLIVHGRYYDDVVNIRNPYHDGIGLWEIDEKGKLVKENYIGFRSGFKDLKFNANNKSSELGFIYTHAALRTIEGMIFLVSEGYKKAADEGGISGFDVWTGVMGGPMYFDNVRYLKIKTSDILISVFDSNFNYQQSYQHEKKSNTSTIEYFNYNSIYQIGQIFNRIGELDFLYAEIDSKDEIINVHYRDYNRGNNRLYKINRLTISDKDPTISIIEKLPNTSETIFLPRGFGRMTIMEYIARKKTLYFEFRK